MLALPGEVCIGPFWLLYFSLALHVSPVCAIVSNVAITNDPATGCNEHAHLNGG